MSRQNIILNSANKSNADELGNDINLRWPNTLFIKAPYSLELLYLNIDFDITTFGNTNNGMEIEYTNNIGETINQEIIVDFYAIPLLSEALTTSIYTAMTGVFNPYYTITFDVINRKVANVVSTQYEGSVFVNTYLVSKISSIVDNIYLLDTDISLDYKYSFDVTTNEIINLVITTFSLFPITNIVHENAIKDGLNPVLVVPFYYRIAADIRTDTTPNQIENILIGWFNTNLILQNDPVIDVVQAPKTIALENIILAALTTITADLYSILSSVTDKYTLAFDITTDDVVNIRLIDYEHVISTDIDLRNIIDLAINSTIYPYYDLTFIVINTNIENIITNYEIEQDLSTTQLTIKPSNNCSLKFNSKESIGPILGFGNGVYKNEESITGTSTQSIEAYYLINVFNTSGNKLHAYSIDPLTDISNLYPEYNDVNCKMELYDSSNNLISNIDNAGLDVAISINRTSGNLSYSNIGDVLDIIQTEMNRYSGNFSPAADFLITYDPTAKKVTITNTTGAKFGIGFDFFKFSDGIVTAGSLHKILGFNQKQYLSVTTITSIKIIKAFQDLFAEDYLLFCSNIVNNNTDINVIGIGNNNKIKNNNILYAIPLLLAEQFRPIDSTYYTIDISSSALARGYADRIYSDENPITVNFYIRLLSGRHLKSNTQWSSILALNYAPPSN